MTTPSLGPLVQSFFLEHLITIKGLRPASVRSYRDTIRLLLCFIAEQKGTKITKLGLEDLSFEHVLGFLRYLEHDRHNHVRTRNQRLAALHTLFDYIAGREPEMLGICQQVAAIPMKRAAPAETHFLERDEVQALLRGLHEEVPCGAEQQVARDLRVTPRERRAGQVTGHEAAGHPRAGFAPPSGRHCVDPLPPRDSSVPAAQWDSTGFLPRTSPPSASRACAC